ncbi:MAG TPA: S41 family peptidase [Magnetospirillaceae bacterium]|nr:S41 family peptidase [Magnetospirillaceae bacterium]
MKRVLLCLLFTTSAWLIAAPAGASAPAPAVTLAFGLSEIHDRALLPISAETLALEGLQGLAALDPAVSVAKGSDRRIQLSYDGQAVASYAAPALNDSVGWGMLLDRIARQAGRKSAQIGHADPDRVMGALFDSMMTKLDVFSHYAGPAEARERRASRSGFGGIGVRYDLAENAAVLNEVMPDSPASDAKLKIGDRVVAIDGSPVAGLDQGAISQKLRGPAGTPVTLSLEQGGRATSLTLQRRLIVLPTVTSSVADGVGVIAVSGFNDNTGASVAEAVRKAKATPNFKGIVLDLRGNYGGLLDQGLAVADVFIAQGPLLTTRGRHPAAFSVYEAKGGDPGEKLPLVVLVDGHTASAAEVTAAALQDSGRATLVGTNSFGKGIIQFVQQLPNEGEIAFTWSRFYVPSGYALHGLGVLPAICTAAGSPAGDKLLAEGRTAPASFFAAWRSVAPDDMARRAKMRGHCQAEDHSHNEQDLAIARHLLTDPALMARALAVAAPVSTASAQHGTPANTRN